MDNKKLIDIAMKVRKFSYAPYSKFKVGAALLTQDEKVYTGCNIENIAFSPTNCAERTAFFKAISEGYIKFSKIAIIGGYDNEYMDFCPPCGICRQVMIEFCDKKSFEIILSNSNKEIKSYTLDEMMPFSFSSLK